MLDAINAGATTWKKTCLSENKIQQTKSVGLWLENFILKRKNINANGHSTRKLRKQHQFNSSSAAKS